MTEAILEPDLPIIDPHHHLWDLSAGRYPWLQQDYDAQAFFLGDYHALRHNFLPPDYRRISAGCQVIATVHVEAERDRNEQVAETAWAHVNRARQLILPVEGRLAATLAEHRAILAALVRGLEAGGVPKDAVQLIPTQDRAAVGEMLKAAGLIDMIVPRGGKSLVARVQADARVPVLAHLDGINHTYLHSAADPAKAVEAFQRRWRPETIDGVIDGETSAILFALLLDRDQGRTR